LSKLMIHSVLMHSYYLTMCDKAKERQLGYHKTDPSIKLFIMLNSFKTKILFDTSPEKSLTIVYF